MKKLFLILTLLFTGFLLAQSPVVRFQQWKQVTTTERDAFTPLANTNPQIYNITTGQFEYWDGDSWEVIGVGTGFDHQLTQNLITNGNDFISNGNLFLYLDSDGDGTAGVSNAFRIYNETATADNILFNLYKGSLNSVDRSLMAIGQSNNLAGYLSIFGNSTTQAGNIQLSNPGSYTTEIGSYHLTTINGNLILLGSGGTSGSAVPAFGIDATDLSITFGNYSFPRVDGSAGQVLKTDGSGSLTWQDESGGSSSASDITVDDASFDEITGTDAQSVFNSIDNAIFDLASASPNNIVYISDYTALSSIASPTDGDLAYVTNDRIKGLFKYDSTLSATDNFGTIIDGWVRQYDGANQIAWFGAIPDDAIDDTVNIQRAIDASYYKTLEFESGEYLISTDTETYAVLISNSIDLINKADTTFKFGDSETSASVMFQVGEYGVVTNNVNITGGIFDGNAEAIDNAAAGDDALYGTSGGAIVVSGQTHNVTINNVYITNFLGVGFEVDGESDVLRASQIYVNNMRVDFCGEGIRLQKANHVYLDGGYATDMLNQDCIEPHGSIDNWSVKNMYFARPHQTNSAVEVFPQFGDMHNGLFEKCVIEDNEARISLSSGSGGYTVYNLTFRNNHFKHSIIYAGVNGNYQNLVIDGNHFEGPSNHPRNIPNFHAISTYLETNTIKVINNRIHDYQYAGMSLRDDNALISNNTIYNNGQDTEGVVYLKVGIDCNGNDAIISNNRIYDDQVTKTQTYASIRTSGDRAIVTGNYGDIDTDLGGVGWKKSGNGGGINDKVRLLATITAGSKFVDLSTAIEAIGMNSNVLELYSAHIQVLDTGGNPTVDQNPMTPATNVWIKRSGGDLDLRVDAALTYDTNFVITFDVSTDYITN